MRTSKNIISILFIMFMVSCSYSSLRPEVVDRSDAQRMQTVVFATVVSIKRSVCRDRFVDWWDVALSIWVYGYDCCRENSNEDR